MYEMEDYKKHWAEMRRRDKEWKEELAEAERKRLEAMRASNPQEEQKPQYFDHPNTMDNLPATILYIVAMIGGSIFTDRIYIWVGATVWWLCHINRHKIRK